MLLVPNRWILLFAAVLIVGGCKREQAAVAPATAPTSKPSTAPAAKPPTTTYVDVIRASNPKVPATQPLAVPVDLRDAGHFVFTDPIYICPRGDLWVTSANALPFDAGLKNAADEQAHVVPEPIVYVLWITDDDGKWLARPVVKHVSDFEWIDQNVRRPLTRGRKYRFEDSVPFGEELVVPTDHGVSMFGFKPDFHETYHEIVMDAKAAPPRVLLDPRGVLAWSPWEGATPGGKGVARFVDGKWTDLGPSPQWPEKMLHIVPLLDGSVLQLYRETPDGPVKLAMATLDAPSVDEKAITNLVEQLSDDDSDKRAAAYQELTRYGSASWPILEKLLPEQPPEATMRIEELLANRLAPTLGGRTPVDGKMTVAEHFTDSGILLHLAAGVSIFQGQDKKPQIVKPAWISIRPGQAIDMLDKVLSIDADPKKQRFFAYGDEWVVSDEVQGPRRLFGNHLEPLLKKEETAYSHVVGFDRRGRWLFRKSKDAPDTLMLDPTVPDETPRLPVWTIPVEKGLVGWTRENYPAIKGSSSLVRTQDAWGLYEHGWKPVEGSKDSFVTAGAIKPPPAPAPAVEKIATTATSTTITSPTTTQRELGPVLLTDAQGRKYYDGKESLIVIDRDGKEIVWPLPGNAVGNNAIALIQTADGLLFLFNQSGRVVRIKPTPTDAEPFVVEKVFTDRIPASETIVRIWLDPAGRIAMIFAPNKVAILFPQGRIPQDIMTLIPAKELD